MARTVEVKLNNIGGYVRIALELNPCGNLNVVPSYCKAQRGAALHMFYLSLGFNRTIGSIIGRSGNYTVWDGQSEDQARGFRTLTEAATYLWDLFVAANLVTVDLDPVYEAIDREAEEVEDEGVNVSTGWVTSEHARTAFHTLAREWSDGGPFYGATHSTQPLFQAQAAFHVLKAAEPQELLALPEKAGNRQLWCANCGQPATDMKRSDFMASGFYQRTKDGAAILKVGGRIGRYCPRCAPVYQFLALPEGFEPLVELDHLTHMTYEASARQAQAMALMDGAEDPEFRIAALRAVGDACHVLAELAQRFLVVHTWPPYHQPWHDRHISYFALNRVEAVDGGQVTLVLEGDRVADVVENGSTYEVTEWDLGTVLDNGGGDLVLY